MAVGTLPRPAGFWPRAAAWTIDGALVAPIALLASWPWMHPAAVAWLQGAESLLRLTGETMGTAIIDGVPLPALALALAHDARLVAASAALHAATWALLAPLLCAFAVAGALWNLAGEQSRWHGSAGKRLLGLQVRDRNGAAPGIAQSLWRHIAGAASWATLNVGHAMAGAAPEHLALHDRISATRVVTVADAPAQLPSWARTWLVLLCIAALAMVAWLANEASAVMRAGLEQALF